MATALPEIDTANSSGNLMAFEHDGTLKWQSPDIWSGSYIGAIALADMDNDGSLMWNSGLAPGYPQVADMDGDGLPEVVLTNANGLALIEHDSTTAPSPTRACAPPAHPRRASPGRARPPFTISTATGRPSMR